jgi:hydroxymethylpyrimidine/phosphomethylpyrimidine kinase
MLHDAPVIETVVAALEADAPGVPLVVDPVMVAKGGASLLQAEAVRALRERLVPRATLLTPNVPEAEALTGRKITDEAGMKAAAEALLALGARAVLLKGGHLQGPVVRDLLVTAADTHVYENPRIDTPHTHGTGCTLASAIAAGLAEGFPLASAVARAEAYLHEAIRTAPGLGHGHGPVNHMHTMRPFRHGF